MPDAVDSSKKQVAKPSRILLIPFAIFGCAGLTVIIAHFVVVTGSVLRLTPNPITIVQLGGHCLSAAGGVLWMCSAPYWRRASWARAVALTLIGYLVAGAGAFLLDTV